MELPLKTSILKYAMEYKSSFTVDDLYRDLAPFYGGEGQFTKARLKDYTDSYLGVKFFNREKVEYNANGELIIYYKITDYGLSRKKYIYTD